MDTEEKVPQEGQPVAPQAPKRKQMSPARKKLVSAVYEFADILVSALLVIFLIFTFCTMRRHILRVVFEKSFPVRVSKRIRHTAARFLRVIRIWIQMRLRIAQRWMS